jgi:hypothetical protein
LAEEEVEVSLYVQYLYILFVPSFFPSFYHSFVFSISFWLLVTSCTLLNLSRPFFMIQYFDVNAEKD